jgi:hypothetical protein
MTEVLVSRLAAMKALKFTPSRAAMRAGLSPGRTV